VLRLCYDSSVLRDSFVFNIWLDIASNLQRIDFTELPIPVLIQVESPYFYNKNIEKEFERHLDRLRDAAHDTHMAYLDNFLNVKEYNNYPEIKEKYDCNCCLENKVCYHYEESSCKEIISFNLNKMDSKEKLMKDTMKRFRGDLKRWHRYNEDRVIYGDISPWRNKLD